VITTRIRKEQYIQQPELDDLVTARMQILAGVPNNSTGKKTHGKNA